MFASFHPSAAKAPSGMTLHPHPPAAVDDDLRAELEQMENVEPMDDPEVALARRMAGLHALAAEHKHHAADVRLGAGSGMAFAPEFGSHATHCASEGGVTVLFRGNVTRWPGIDPVEQAHSAFVAGDAEPPRTDDASLLLRYYKAKHGENPDAEAPGLALASLAALEGRFAFVLHDASWARVMAGRDRSGAEELFWGTTAGDGSLLFGSHAQLLADCNPSAAPFPPGCLYLSEGTAAAECPGPQGWILPARVEAPGVLLPFTGSQKRVRPIPRITSRGVLCGAVFRVASAGDMSGGGLGGNRAM